MKDSVIVELSDDPEFPTGKLDVKRKKSQLYGNVINDPRVEYQSIF